MIDKDTAIEILGQAAVGVFTFNDEFKEACEMGKAALAREAKAESGAVTELGVRKARQRGTAAFGDKGA